MQEAIFGLSNHAAIRSQQRGIPLAAVEVLLEYGMPKHTKGCISYSMHKRSRQKLLADLGESQYRVLEKWLDCYAVISPEGALLTVAFRTRRARRD